MSHKYIDFNVDAGESFGLWKMGNDEALFDYITTANLACGFHAGDPGVMDRTVRMAKEKGIAVGAHFGYPDKEGFGRRRMMVSGEVIANYTTYQLGALDAFLRKYDMKMQHIKPHGALWSDIIDNEETSVAMLEAVKAYDPDLRIIIQKATVTHQIAKDMGFRVYDEFYLDRGVMETGRLVFNYSLDDIGGNHEAAVNRAIGVLEEGKATAVTGKEIDVKTNCFCVHGDTPNIVNLARMFTEEMIGRGYEFKPIGEWDD